MRQLSAPPSSIQDGAVNYVSSCFHMGFSFDVIMCLGHSVNGGGG
jgi:hypothetical protein